jgi:methyl-accepting chemotaxis protein
VQEIAAASQEQSTGVGQVNAAMNQMNQITQQNASASNELAATAEEMSAQSEQLQSLMGFFKIDDKQSAEQMRAGRQQMKKPLPANTSQKGKHIDRAINSGFDESKFERF